MNFRQRFKASHLDANPLAQDSELRKFLTFRLGVESFGIDTLKVQEIRAYEAPTPVAHVPAFIKGFVTLRGVIVPILDLRIKFKLGTPAITSSPS